MNSQPLQPLGHLLSRTLAFYRAHLRFVMLVTLPVVAFVEIVVGIGLGEFTAGVHKQLPEADGIISAVARALVTVPVVTAIFARALVIERREGSVPTARRAAEEGLELFAPALLAVVLYSIGVASGLVFLILPGLYFLVSWYFVVQAVVIDGSRGFGSITTSSSLVRGHWWHTAAVVICLDLIADIPGVILVNALQGLAKALNSYAIVIAGDILVDTLALPFVAIGATLYYLELRERAALPGPR